MSVKSVSNASESAISGASEHAIPADQISEYVFINPRTGERLLRDFLSERGVRTRKLRFESVHGIEVTVEKVADEIIVAEGPSLRRVQR